MNLAPGTRFGRYEVRSLLGAGGMGEVYLAYDHDLEREVAIKVLRYGASETSDRVRRFIQEAKAASALNHPNVAHVYEIGSHDNLRFMAMEIVEGETLRARLGLGPLPIDDALAIGLQIAAALAAAHKAGIVHRDVKPENVIIRPDGYAKVLDFGLAKLREPRGQDAATVLKTAEGVAMGTLGYMAPEQISGGDITPAADVFSLGVVLYEMVSGHRPVEGASPLHDVPPKLEAVIAKALSKNAQDRYPSAAELHDELRQISRETAARPVPKPPPKRWPIAAALVILVLAAGAWMLVRAKRRASAAQRIATAQRLVEERKLPEAYEAASAAAEIVPDDERVREVFAKSTAAVSITSDPPGATVSLQRFKGPEAPVHVGTTPLKIPRLARADYLVTVEKQGYATVTRPLPIAPFFVSDIEGRRMPADIQIRMLESAKVPPRMVLVAGALYRLAGWYRASDRAVQLRDFFIDRYEVSNRDFAEFVRAGGYRRPELWKHPFVLDGKTISFEAAISRFRDTTGLPGPRSWSGGAPPAGRENNPVTDVTWYEAAAFAQWSGKNLPTVYQWERAGRYPSDRVGTSLPFGVAPEGVDVTERANFLGKGTMPVDSMPFGMSPWGAQHMAGNVSEWCRNPNSPGYAARGGGWNDAIYAFGRTGAYPGFYSAPTLGFRCVKNLDAVAGDEGEFALSPSGFVPAYHPVGDREYAEIRKRYDYERGPLDARVIETVDTPEWRREKVTYNVAGKRSLAYLYLPKGFRRPLQVIHFAPAGDVENGLRSLPASTESNLAPVIRSGRAVFTVALEGYLDRPRKTEVEEPDSRSTQYVDYVVSRVTELRGGLDYLQTRPEIDGSRIAFVAMSAGTWAGVVIAAVENRYRSVLFMGVGVHPREVTDAPAANRINFLPRIAAPKMVLQGRYDESSPLKSDLEPLYRLLREPKRLEVYEGGHVPPPDVRIRVIQKWLDETLGPVGG
jgi:formylglycine-generating enzyme required for sulfatase activity/dienelactone hydrolase